jgi:hypothetical protein
MKERLTEAAMDLIWEDKVWSHSGLPPIQGSEVSTHLILPDLVDARIRKLGLQPAASHDTARLSPDHYEKLNIYSICYSSGRSNF